MRMLSGTGAAPFALLAPALFSRGGALGATHPTAKHPKSRPRERRDACMAKSVPRSHLKRVAPVGEDGERRPQPNTTAAAIGELQRLVALGANHIFDGFAPGDQLGAAVFPEDLWRAALRHIVQSHRRPGCTGVVQDQQIAHVRPSERTGNQQFAIVAREHVALSHDGPASRRRVLRPAASTGPSTTPGTTPPARMAPGPDSATATRLTNLAP